MSENVPTTDGTRGDERRSRLATQAAALPRAPGVYLLKDASGRVVYVGKAARLRDRVGSYFQPSADLGARKQRMLEVVEAFDTLDCESEWEALLAENRLIKDVRPRFNARLTDDKTFPYLVVTTRDAFPGVFVTRQPAAEEYRGGRVFGPFASAGGLRRAVEHLQSVFRFRTCTLEISESDEARRFFRPCLLHAIDRCSAPCADKVSRESYGADIDALLRFLSSKRGEMLREMRREMEEASGSMEFERAAGLRDRIRAIERLGERGTRQQGWQPETEAPMLDPRKSVKSLERTLGCVEPIRCIEGIDIAHLMGGETVGSKVCFVDGRPLRNEYRRFRVKRAGNDDYAAIREVVSRRYREAGAGHELYPDVILIDGGLGQLHAAMEAFGSLEAHPPMVIALAKKEELIYTQARSEPIRLGRDNPGLRLCQAVRDEAHRFAQHYHHVLRRKRSLGEDGGGVSRAEAER